VNLSKGVFSTEIVTENSKKRLKFKKKEFVSAKLFKEAI